MVALAPLACSLPLYFVDLFAHYMLLTSCLCNDTLQLCFACLFAYFFITNFLALYRTQQFVSVDPESGICKQVSCQLQLGR